MLKFQDNYSIEIENMEDLFLISYVMIDELYKQYAPQEVTKRKNILPERLKPLRQKSTILIVAFCHLP